MTHTPAPWKKAYEITENDNFTHSIYEDDYKGTLICRCNQNNSHIGDAHLIETAPDMYEALKEARTDLMIFSCNAAEAAKTDKRWQGVSEILNERVKKCDKALAKAEGEKDE